jgi:uncharacterized protein
LLRLGLGIYAGIMKLAGVNIGRPSSASIIESIVSINEYYHPLLGFLLVVMIVPVYEEIIFRGIFLSSMEKNIRFFWANSIQAFLFALVHMDLKLFPFYLAVGYVAGYQKRKTEALATGMSMHMTNNLIAFIGILFYKS